MREVGRLSHRLPPPRFRLLLFRAFPLPGTITLTCGSQTTPGIQLAAGQRQTIVTAWSTNCTTLSIRSTNGWDTNFDNLMIQ